MKLSLNKILICLIVIVVIIILVKCYKRNRDNYMVIGVDKIPIPENKRVIFSSPIDKKKIKKSNEKLTKKMKADIKKQKLEDKKRKDVIKKKQEELKKFTERYYERKK